jgi:hypothetical protein
LLFAIEANERVKVVQVKLVIERLMVFTAARRSE